MESGKCLTLYAFYLYVACEQAVGSRSGVGKRASAERAFSQPLFPLNTYSKAGFKKGCPRHNYEHFSENVARKDPKVKEGFLFLEMYVLLSFKKNSDKFPGDFPTSFELTLKVCTNGCVYFAIFVEHC